MARAYALLVALLGLALLPSCLAMVSYENHRYIRVNTPNEVLHQWFFDTFDVLEANYDHFELRVDPAQFNLLRNLGFDIEVLNDNVEALLDADRPSPNRIDWTKMDLTALNTTWFSEYHTYAELKTWYQQNAATYGATFIPSIGKSHQGRDLFAIVFGTAGKPGIYLQGLQHAREWVGGSSVNYLTWYFLTQDRSFLPNYQFIIVPVVNPDGYEYSWTTDRLWRKNRRSNGASFGVDTNRNWNSHWGQGGSSSNPASDTYMGPSVASEPEVQAIVKFFLTYTNIIAAFDIHSYSQLILRPYGWKTGSSEHEAQHFEAGSIIQSEIRAVDGKFFENIHSIDLYITTGTSSDWYYDEEVKTKFGHRIYAFTLELRPTTAVPGFNLPPDQIIPSGEELVPAFRQFIAFANANQIRT